MTVELVLLSCHVFLCILTLTLKWNNIITEVFADILQHMMSNVKGFTATDVQ